MSSNGSNGSSGSLGRADALGAYGFLRPHDEDRSRGSVDDPKVGGRSGSYRR